MLNVVAIQGRVVADIELKQSKSGKSVCTARVAVGRQYSGASAQDGSPEADFFDVVAWGKTAEFLSRNFSRGQMVLVSGRLSTREWTDRDNKKRVTVEIIADSVNFGGDRKRDYEQESADRAGASYSYPSGNTFPRPASQDGFGSFGGAEDVPF